MAEHLCSGAGLVSLVPHPEHQVRRSGRVVAALAELHKIGFQRLRGMPYLSPNGASWRFEIGPINLFYRAHGAVSVSECLLTHSNQRAIREISHGMARYSSADAIKGMFFGWEDSTDDNARILADKLLQRFPVLAREGKGWDYAYAGWFQRFVGLVEAGFFPYAFGDMQGPSSHGLYISSIRPSEWNKAQLLSELPPPPPPPGEYDETLILEETIPEPPSR